MRDFRSRQGGLDVFLLLPLAKHIYELEISREATKGELWKVLRGRRTGLGPQGWRNRTTQHQRILRPYYFLTKESPRPSISHAQPSNPGSREAHSCPPRSEEESWQQASPAALTGRLTRTPTNNKLRGDVLSLPSALPLPCPTERHQVGWPGSTRKEGPAPTSSPALEASLCQGTWDPHDPQRDT